LAFLISKKWRGKWLSLQLIFSRCGGFGKMKNGVSEYLARRVAALFGLGLINGAVVFYYTLFVGGSLRETICGQTINTHKDHLFSCHRRRSHKLLPSPKRRRIPAFQKKSTPSDLFSADFFISPKYRERLLN